MGLVKSAPPGSNWNKSPSQIIDMGKQMSLAACLNGSIPAPAVEVFSGG